MTENQKLALFFVAWIGGSLAVLQWILWRIKHDDEE